MPSTVPPSMRRSSIRLGGAPLSEETELWRRHVSLLTSPHAAIPVVNDLQALQCELRIDLVDVLAIVLKEGCQSTCRHNALETLDLAFHAGEQSVHQPEVTEVDAGLHVDDGVRTDDARRTPDIDARQACGACE